MLKKLAFVLALVIPATASADRLYDIKAVRIERGLAANGVPSCRALPRMMKDKHRLRVRDDGRAFVNGKRWKVQVNDKSNLLLTFHYEAGQFTWLFMDFHVNDNKLEGRYALVGMTPKRLRCFDIVFVEGIRR